MNCLITKASVSPECHHPHVAIGAVLAFLSSHGHLPALLEDKSSTPRSRYSRPGSSSLTGPCVSSLDASPDEKSQSDRVMIG